MATISTWMLTGNIDNAVAVCYVRRQPGKSLMPLRRSRLRRTRWKPGAATPGSPPDLGGPKRVLHRSAGVAGLFSSVSGASAVSWALGDPGTLNARPEVPAQGTAQATAKWEKLARRLTARLGVLRRAEARSEANAGSHM
ncbi:MAG TPA: hypothetical protein VI455_11210 [Terriglobia bacterium]